MLAFLVFGDYTDLCAFAKCGTDLDLDYARGDGRTECGVYVRPLQSIRPHKQVTRSLIYTNQCASVRDVGPQAITG